MLFYDRHTGKNHIYIGLVFNYTKNYFIWIRVQISDLRINRGQEKKRKLFIPDNLVLTQMKKSKQNGIYIYIYLYRYFEMLKSHQKRRKGCYDLVL